MKKSEGTGNTNAGKGYIFPKAGRAARAASFSGALGRAGLIGLHPISGLLVGGGAGYFLWKKFDAGWIFWILLLAGFIAGCLNARREALAYLREQNTEEERL